MSDSVLLEKRISDVENTSGSGTCFISLYTPSGKSIQSVRNQIQQEQSEADNIKSDSNRKKVKKSLSRTEKCLSRYKSTPKNGLIVFTGINDKGDPVEYVFDKLPEELNYSNYLCDNKFHTDELKKLIQPDNSVGLLVVERGGYTTGEVSGSKIIEHRSERSSVQGKHNAGGFSNRRFDRVIEEQKEKFFDSIKKELKSQFVDKDGQPTISGLVIGGTKITVDGFISDGHVPTSLRDIISGGTHSVDVSLGRQALEQLVSSAKEEINRLTSQEERIAAERFIKGMNSDEIHVTYGESSVEKAIENGGVKKLLISEKYDSQAIVDYKEMVENQGGELITIGTDFEAGNRIWIAFGGIVAILRYDMGWL